MSLSHQAQPQQAAARLQAIQELGQPGMPPKLEGGIHCLPIVGQVEGHVVLPAKSKTTKYEHVIPQLVAVEQNPNVKGLIVILNTVGGDIEAGLAIAEMVRSLSKPTASLILGGGHSIGLPIAVAAQRSFIASTATVTVHPIRLTGLVIGVPQTYEYLDKMQDRVIRFIVENSRISEAALRELMFRTGELVRDVGTVLIGRDAVTSGLIDEVGGLAEALSYLQGAIERRARETRPLASPSLPMYQEAPQRPAPPSQHHAPLAPSPAPMSPLQAPRPHSPLPPSPLQAPPAPFPAPFPSPFPAPHSPAAAPPPSPIQGLLPSLPVQTMSPFTRTESQQGDELL